MDPAHRASWSALPPRTYWRGWSNPFPWWCGTLRRLRGSAAVQEQAEAIAAVNGEDALFYVRFQLAEMLGSTVDVRAINQTVNEISGCLVTDSRNVYDKLETETFNIRGAEKRTDIEMLALKQAQERNQVRIRWGSWRGTAVQRTDQAIRTQAVRSLLQDGPIMEIGRG